MDVSKNITAGIIVIGNEILSGRTEEKNVNFIAKNLSSIGIDLSEVIVIPDIEEKIIQTIRDYSSKFDYVFTTGGIGPTHDDITTASVAKAFNLDLELNQEAYENLDKFYKSRGEELNPARIKMAYVPKGAKTVENSLTIAPGFKINNVYVFAGVPKIMQKMFNVIFNDLNSSERFYSKSIEIDAGESSIAQDFDNLQKQYPEIIMGSYPIFSENKFGTSLVLRSKNTIKIEEATQKLLEKISNLGFEVVNIIEN